MTDHPAGPSTDELVWYAAFGSNLLPSRLGAYLAGGRPPGSRRTYSGGRDAAPPRESRTVTLPGHLHFGGVSTVWGGGLAFYEPGPSGSVHGRAYLITFGQFSDLVAQEARRSVGTDLVLASDGHTYHGLSAIYDAVVPVGDLDERPMLTLTTTALHPSNAPSAAYVAVILAGLADGFGLTDAERVDYLLAARGVRPTWTREGLAELL